MLHIASSLTDAVGRAFYHEFVKAGVADMPAINGEVPARTVKSVPAGYGKRFGTLLYVIVLKKVHNPDLTEEILTEALLRVAAGKLKLLREGSSLKEAERYSIQLVQNTISDVFRKNVGQGKERRPQRFQDIDDDPVVNLADPNAFRALDRMISRSDLTKLMRDLEKVDARAPSWLEAKLDGCSSTDIARDWGVGKSRVSGWEKEFLPDIKRVLSRYVQDAA
jgi:hypothetical protein